MVINQGAIFWIDLGEPGGSEPGYQRPCVVVQNNVFNHSEIPSVVVCSLTTNLKLADCPGNVLLDRREAGLPKQSVVNVSQLSKVFKTQLGEHIGTLSSKRVREIVSGIKLVIEPREPD